MGKLGEMQKHERPVASKYHLFFHTSDKVRDRV